MALECGVQPEHIPMVFGTTCLIFPRMSLNPQTHLAESKEIQAVQVFHTPIYLQNCSREAGTKAPSSQLLRTCAIGIPDGLIVALTPKTGFRKVGILRSLRAQPRPSRNFVKLSPLRRKSLPRPLKYPY